MDSSAIIRVVGLLAILAGGSGAGGETVVVVAREASFPEVLAAREVRRYVYLRTGELLPIVKRVPAGGDAIVIASSDELGRQEYRLRTGAEQGRRVLRITGGGGVAALYGAYRLAERLGVRFYLDGDVIPDETVALRLPDLDETHRPLFELRGIQPFHDFTEGPDWWSADDYKAHLSQLAKLRMNFLGLHCYPESGRGPEPTVWIGLPEDVHADGTVRFSYPSRYASTHGGSWGYAPTKTGAFAAGASLLFEGDHVGAPVTDGHRPRPKSVADCNEVFNRTAAMFRAAFSHGRALGVKFCIGTETPLTVPKAVRERLEKRGMKPGDPATVRKLYEGMFTRIARAHPLDYYWLWTPEGWTWGGAKQSRVDAAVRDVELALEALEQAGRPFGFATCGWVLGPPADRTLFDKILPKDVALSCINRQVGFTPVEPGFSRIEGRPQWAIPWLEDDPAMVIPQLWAGRMRRDAADAAAYGCTGLMGIHWRTKALGPNVSALASAAWDQRGWNPQFGKRIKLPAPMTTDVHVGGRVDGRPPQPVADTEDDAVYQTCRWNLSAYRLKVPDGTYTVTLKFCETAHKKAGKRVFDVKLQGQQVVEKLDVFARVGALKPLDLSFRDVTVTDGTLTVGFVKHVEYPFVAGIVIEGRPDGGRAEDRPFQRRINCGGKKYRDYEADLRPLNYVPPRPGLERDLACDDFYADWARAHFGPEAASELARLFAGLDGGPGNYGKGRSHLPRPATWIGGPGGIAAKARDWEQEKQRYAFVDQMADLRGKVRGAGNLSRFDYWLNSFRYLRAVGQLSCTRGRLDQIIKQIGKEKDPAKKKRLAKEKALPMRIELSRQWEQMMTLQLAVTDTPGEIGTVANLEQHVRRNTRSAHFLDLHDKKLAGQLGTALPAAVRPTERYLGKPRLIVPTRRTRVREGEALTIKVIVLDAEQPCSAALHWRPLGTGAYREIDLTHLARAVYTVTLPPARGQAIEYFIRATTRNQQRLVWPATAPGLNQTLVVTPAT